MADTDNKTIDRLNSLLRGEISAVETYRQAVEKIDQPEIRTVLEENQGMHGARAQRLRQRIEQLGGKPSESSGAWGAIAKAAEGAATIGGDKKAIDMLEEGEDRGLEDYRKILDDVDSETAMMIQSELLPGQERTHAVMRSLKHRGNGNM
jgi:uncharacterized protein (TIGR02284 family)